MPFNDEHVVRKVATMRPKGGIQRGEAQPRRHEDSDTCTRRAVQTDDNTGDYYRRYCADTCLRGVTCVLLSLIRLAYMYSVGVVAPLRVRADECA